MKKIITEGKYALDASGQTILLSDTSITLEQILSIKNISQHQDIYDSRFTRKNTLTPDEITPGLFHFSYKGMMTDNDILQIFVDLPNSPDPVYPFGLTGTSLDAGKTIQKPDSGFVNIDGAYVIWLTGSYTGSATSVTIVVDGYADEDDDADPIATMTLDSSSAENMHAKIQVPPGLPFMTLSAKNNDSTNSAKIKAIINMVR